MKSTKINRETSFTPKERDELIRGLIDAGIDKKVVGDLLGGGPTASCSETSYCGHGPCPAKGKCDSHFMVNPDSMGRIRDIMKEKNIDPRKFGKIAKKFE